MQDYVVVKAFVRKAEDILNIPGTTTFRGEDARGDFLYDRKLNALDGLKMKVEVLEPGMQYDYIVKETGDIRVRADWLSEIEYDVDWPEVPINEVIEVSSGNGLWYKMHFAGYEPDAPDGKRFGVFSAGRSSGTSLDINEKINITTVSWTNLSGKHIKIYDTENSYYIWFNLDDESIDPVIENSTSIEVNIETGEPAESIANKIAAQVDLLENFSAIVLPSNNRIVEIDVLQPGRVFDANAADSGMTVTTKMQGGDIFFWLHARPILP